MHYLNKKQDAALIFFQVFWEELMSQYPCLRINYLQQIKLLKFVSRISKEKHTISNICWIFSFKYSHVLNICWGLKEPSRVAWTPHFSKITRSRYTWKLQGDLAKPKVIFPISSKFLSLISYNSMHKIVIGIYFPFSSYQT